jgi:putative glutamine amidotransferase
VAPSTRPVIGVTCYEEQAAWGSWHRQAALLPASYVRAVEAAGGSVLLLPPQRLSPEEAVDLVSRLDGLVLAGGNDVDPALFGEDPHPKTVVAKGERDALELATLEAAVSGCLPTLAICRGLQVLNVARGGTLIQHLPDVVGHNEHSPEPDGYGEHLVHLEEGSRLSSLVSWESARVPTHHHQGIGMIGEGLVASAHAEDGVVEALEDTSMPFLLGVQWHPEAGEDHELFVGLTKAASERARSKEPVR